MEDQEISLPKIGQRVWGVHRGEDGIPGITEAVYLGRSGEWDSCDIWVLDKDNSNREYHGKTNGKEMFTTMRGAAWYAMMELREVKESQLEFLSEIDRELDRLGLMSDDIK